MSRLLSCIAVTLALWPASTLQAASASKLVADGNQAYATGELERALELYLAAEIETPDDPLITFNIGNALHRLGKLDEAHLAFDRARQLAAQRAAESSSDVAATSASLAADAAFNLGNTQFRSGQFSQAVDSFIGALTADPTARDAKHNLELALRMLEQQPPDSGEGSPEEEGEGPNQTGARDAPQPSEQAKQPATQAPESAERRPKESQQLLDAVEQAERSSRRQRSERPAANRGGIDW